MDRLGITKRRAGGLTLAEWEALKGYLSKTSDNNQKKIADAERVKKTSVEANIFVIDTSGYEAADGKTGSVINQQNDATRDGALNDNSDTTKNDAAGKRAEDEVIDEVIVRAAGERTVNGKTDQVKRQGKIAAIDTATMRMRLSAAKQEFDFNKMLITMFQAEANKYFRETGGTTMMSHNGAMVSIPAIVNLEKYVKLNIAVSKLVSELESDLDIDEDDLSDPFA